MTATATHLADAIRGLIDANHLPWHVTQIGARAEIMFMPRQPRSGADVIAGRQPDLETLLRAFYMNEGILVTPFHTMLLMCPATSDHDVDRHTAVFVGFIDLLRKAGAI
jgi:glutamate-1-semialdehyde 2,1-aminomutase